MPPPHEISGTQLCGIQNDNPMLAWTNIVISCSRWCTAARTGHAGPPVQLVDHPLLTALLWRSDRVGTRHAVVL
jgi:hypothetical protein